MEITWHPFTLTLGDEFQALLEVDAPVFQIIDTLRLELNRHNFVLVLDLERLLTAIDPLQSVGADGPAYWNARQHQFVPSEKMTMAIHRFIFQAGRKTKTVVNALIASGEAHPVRSWRDESGRDLAQSSKEICL
ncbi:MAG: SatD family protein [Streptococcus parasanguinis]